MIRLRKSPPNKGGGKEMQNWRVDRRLRRGLVQEVQCLTYRKPEKGRLNMEPSC